MHKGIRKPFHDDVRHVHAELSWQGRSAHVSVIRSSGIQKPIARREGGSGLFLFGGACFALTQKFKTREDKKDVEERIRDSGASRRAGDS